MQWKLIGCSLDQAKGYNTPVLNVIFLEISVKLAEKNKFVTHFFQRRFKTCKNRQKPNISEDFRQKGLPVTLKIKFPPAGRSPRKKLAFTRFRFELLEQQRNL